MTDHEIFTIFFTEDTPTKGLRAVFKAGQDSIIEDVASTFDDVEDFLVSLPDYTVKNLCK